MWLRAPATTITNAYLAAVDRDNTTEQRQFRITQTTTQGTVLLNGAALGVGSTFTQKDVNDNKVAYRHSGGEITPNTADGLGTYNDKFHFVVNDGVLQDSGAGADNNVFLITLAPANGEQNHGHRAQQHRHHRQRHRHKQPGDRLQRGRITRRIRQRLLFGLVTFILLLNRSQNPAQDIQLLAFRARTGKQTAQFIHHLPRMVSG